MEAMKLCLIKQPVSHLVILILFHVALIHGGPSQPGSSRNGINAKTWNSKHKREQISESEIISDVIWSTTYPQQVPYVGIADQVTVEHVTESSATIFWQHSDNGKDRDYHMVGYEVQSDTYLVKKKVEDILVDGNVHWRYRLIQEDLTSDTNFIFCILPEITADNGTKTYREISDGKHAIYSPDCVSFKTRPPRIIPPQAVCNTPGYMKPVAGIVVFAIMIWICLCILLTILRYCTSEEDDKGEKKDNRSFLGKLVGHATSKGSTKQKYKPTEAKYLGDFRPDFQEITEEVNKNVKN